MMCVAKRAAVALTALWICLAPCARGQHTTPSNAERDRWDAARAAGTSLEAARIALDALTLGSAPPATLDQRLAFELGVALIRAGDDARALELQAALHRRVDAPWSAFDLAQTLARVGDPAGADRVLADHLFEHPDDSAFWNARGLVWLGAGDRERALAHLGAALRTGSADTRMTLARLALAAGERDIARAGFRRRVAPRTGDASAGDGGGSRGPSDWGLRGWGLTLLPPPARRGPPLAAPLRAESSAGRIPLE